jgi:murein DD-endopeptidase MepM/ murein hydrolase activator NlpD
MNPAEYTSSYGPRIHPITGRSSFHTGLDISSPQGTPVVAPANAVLARMVSGDSIYGNELVLAHNRTLDTMYGHMSAFAKGLQPGMKIRAGQVIGYVGSTGLSTGPHLHWETWNNGQPVNPVTFVGGS